jgi:cardiolipin synthase
LKGNQAVGQRWIEGNNFRILENGEEFYPRVFEVIAAARYEVLLETFILYEDKVGKALHAALLAAAENGARVDVTIDGFGSPSLSDEYVASLAEAGVRVHVFDPGPRLFGQRLNVFRRMHRKLLVVDGKRAFVGGINFSADHLADFGPEAKQDYAVEAEGPIVAHIRRFMQEAIARGKSGRRWFQRRAARKAVDALPAAGEAKAMFVTRDNRTHHKDIERHYRLAIRLARERVVIANAYFFPGFLFLKDLRKAARRGVQVKLILQGKPDMAIVRMAASMLYYHLLRAGVEIHEYCDRPLHGKVALVDNEWSTVGSSNLDPLSLSLNLEANLMIHDRGFNRQLSEKLQRLMAESCRRIEAKDLKESNAWRQVRGFFVYHFLRHYPALVGLLPAHAPKLESLQPASTPAGSDRVTESAGT